ncbi:hypothetical protein [Aquisediminimonas profunda]|uniref:hypothetical protein n=1 Tax=Aquisediminimonas profunda TaxID=1550733 RepID=UPI001C635144|nr:hypothetical protein [Aquisediminimonas profunda]
MKRTDWTWLVGSAALLCLGAAATPSKKAAAPAAKPAAVAVPQPKARYAMDIGTTSGLAGMAGGGAGAAMSMMFGGGGRESHELHLRLGSTLSTTGAPVADHFFQPAAKLGKSVPLVTPVQAPSKEEPGQMPRDFQRPKGRLLLYWGCGVHAPKGQPAIIDFSKIGTGQPMPNLYTARIPVDRGPSVANSRTYGEWPNAKSSKQPQSGSLLGNHRISSSYAPEIQFVLAQDYLDGLHGATSPGADGSVNLSWNSVPAATGYYAWVMGMKMDSSGGDGPRDMVWWSSSAGREFGGGLYEWLSPAVVQQLIADRTVMPPSQTSCTVPAEVKAAAPDFMIGNLYAYGPETNIAYPPRPATGPWNLEWTARIRYRSTTSWMIGGPMANSTPQKNGKPCKPSLFGAVTGLGC